MHPGAIHPIIQIAQFKTASAAVASTAASSPVGRSLVITTFPPGKMAQKGGPRRSIGHEGTAGNA